MREKIQIAFSVLLIGYVAILSGGFYVSVYITYFTIPVLALLGLLGFGSFKYIHNTSSMVFYITIALTIATVATVSYTGVYLIYIAVAILLISGFLMMITKTN